MRNAFRLALGLSAASVFGAAFIVACSDDTSVNASGDGGVVVVPDAQTDAPRSDSATDGGADTAPPFDGGFIIDTFDKVLATEECKKLATCCFGTAMPAEGGADGGTFDTASCVSKLMQFGFQGSNLQTELRDAGNVVLDQVKADECINRVKGLACNVVGTDYTAARASCFEVYTGKFAAGHACAGSVECQPGLFCKGQVDAGPGTCAAIGGAGASCGDNPDSPVEYEEACSYRGGGGSGNYCKYSDFATGGTDLPDAAAWKCTPANGAGAPCQSSTWCKDTICDDTTLHCTTPDRLFDSTCATFVK